MSALAKPTDEQAKGIQSAGSRTAAMDPQDPTEVARKGGSPVSRNTAYGRNRTEGGQTVQKSKIHMPILDERGRSLPRTPLEPRISAISAYRAVNGRHSISEAGHYCACNSLENRQSPLRVRLAEPSKACALRMRQWTRNRLKWSRARVESNSAPSPKKRAAAGEKRDFVLISFGSVLYTLA